MLDALQEDLERPSRRLVLVGGGCQTRGHVGESSIPHEAGVTFMDMTTNDSDVENSHRSGEADRHSP